MKRFSILFAILLALICIPYITSAQENDEGQGEGAEIPETDESDAVEITDTNLASAIRSTLGLGTDAEITASDMLNLTSLQAKKAGISDLSGLAHATHLTTLNLASNSISNLTPLKDLLSLNHLDLYSNQVTDLGSLSGLESLTSLEVGKNVITDIEALGDLTSLTSLYLDDNKLTDFSDLSSLTGLSVLSLSKTGISDLSVLEKLTNLTQLYLTGNEISSITALSKLPKLGWLFLAQNQISDVSPLVGVESLMSLRLLGNPVSDASLLYPLTQGGLIDVDIEIPPPSDTDPPSVVITVPTTAQNGAFDVTITFSEAVSGFEQSDLSISGAATATVTAWSTTDDTVFTATITPTRDSEMMLSVAAGVATDAANNNNTASETLTVTVDMTSPGVSLSVPADAQNGAFDVTITFTQVVSNFLQADLTLSGTAAATVTAWSSTDDRVYTATVTPTTSGNVVLSIAAGVATDAAGNQNTASDSQTVTVTLEWMPDANLKAAVRGALGLQAEETLTTAKMTELRTLDAPLREIEKLTGLEHATSLTNLDLGDNSISDIKPLEDLTSLTNLELDDNSISDIKPLEDLTSLKELDLRDNSISEIKPLEDLTSLMKLNLATNSISDVSDLKGLTNLTDLWLGGNSISDVSDLKDLTNLTSLYLTANSISDVSDLKDLTSLTMLDMAINSISDVNPLKDLTSLEHLYLYENSVSDVSGLKDLTSLKHLYLYKNSISDVSDLKDLTNLTTLDLGKNSISDVSDLKDLTNLKSLRLDHNSIRNVSVFEKLTSLEWVWLAGNPISDTSPLYDLLSANGGTITYIDIDVSRYAPWDVNKDGSVDASDVALVTAALGQSGADIIDSRTDVNGDGTVDADDLTLVTENLDADDAAAPSAIEGIASLLDPAVLESLDPEVLAAQLSSLRSKSDGSLKYLRAIALLESVLSALRPAETLLLANYPNPFNPETWIPYHLSNPSQVVITLYDVRGSVVRRLELGHQREGYYTSRSRAAYWDGRNSMGERVASGVYLYQLQADNISLLRKMLLLK